MLQYHPLKLRPSSAARTNILASNDSKALASLLVFALSLVFTPLTEIRPL